MLILLHINVLGYFSSEIFIFYASIYHKPYLPSFK